MSGGHWLAGGLAASLPVGLLVALTVSTPEPCSDVQLAGSAERAPGWDPRAEVADKQQANARTIVEVGLEHDVPPKGLVAAIATSKVETQLLNLPYGDRDSVGLFQQRREGWAPASARRDPEQAAAMFYTGGQDGAPGLLDIDGWQDMAAGEAAGEVQKPDPDYLDRYGEQVRFATRVVTALTGEGVDLEATDGDDLASCAGTAAASSSKLADVPRENPRTPKEAIAWARAQVAGGPDWYRRCMAFVAQAYGWGYSGYTSKGTVYAIDNYYEPPARFRHTDHDPPPGALMFWDTGEPAGHVALYLGDGKIASNDVRRTGYIDVVPYDAPETEWGADYVGWTDPYFPNAG